MDKLQAYWQDLSPREKQLVAIMSVVLVIGILYWGVWKQLADKVDSLEKQVATQSQTNIWAEQSIAKIKAAGSANRPSSSSSISQIVNRTKSRYKLNISRMQPKSDKLQIWIDEAIFNDLVAWIAELENRHNITVSVFDVSRADQQGRVKVRRLELEKS